MLGGAACTNHEPLPLFRMDCELKFNQPRSRSFANWPQSTRQRTLVTRVQSKDKVGITVSSSSTIRMTYHADTSRSDRSSGTVSFRTFHWLLLACSSLMTLLFLLEATRFSRVTGDNMYP